MTKRVISAMLLLAAIASVTPSISAKKFTAKSPDGKLTLVADVTTCITWQLMCGKRTVITPSELSITLDDGTVWGHNAKSVRVKTTQVDTEITTPLYRRAKVRDNYTQLLLSCNGYAVEFRVYDDAAAYRFVGRTKGTLKIKDEHAEFNFPADYKAFVPYISFTKGEKHTTNFETYYTEQNISEMESDKLCSIPLIVDLGEGMKAAILDAGGEDYPGMFVKRNPAAPNSVVSEFAGVPDGITMEINKPTNLKTTPMKRHDYIATVAGTRTMPWRVIITTTDDTKLAECDIAQKLAPPCRLEDISWIHPGKAAWEWLHAGNVTGVDFKSGINTKTYKHYIDFASDFGIPYMIIDAGWSDKKTLEVIPEINLEELTAYGKQKNVGLILWMDWEAILPVADKMFPYYAKMGIKGFKIDHIDDDDQPMMASLRDLAAAAAKNKLIINYHGAKAVGLHRPYPNIVTYEGVKGLEHCKWMKVKNGRPEVDFPRYDVIIPFGRQLIGPLDYTPGLMRNATPQHFRAVNDAPMSIGTRAHQMALYTLYDSPLQIMGDAPQNYYREVECTRYIVGVPCVFDESRTLAAQVGEYILGARRKGTAWYAAALTNSEARTLDVPLSFLGEGAYRATIFADGVNADRNAEDYKKIECTVTKNDVLKAIMQPGGGWNARFEKL